MKKLIITSMAGLSIISGANAGFYGAVRGAYSYIQADVHQTTNAMYILNPTYPFLKDAVIVDDDLGDSLASYKLAIGYDYKNIRAEVEYAGFTKARFSGAWENDGMGTMANTYGLNTQIQTLFANISYKFDMGCKLNPFVSVGLGTAFIAETGEVDVNITVNSYHESFKSAKEYTTNFAYNVGLGFEYDLTDNVSLDLSYRYSDLGKIDNSTADDIVKSDWSMHEVILGAKYKF